MVVSDGAGPRGSGAELPGGRLAASPGRERAIFEYYRLRQSTDDWKEAFQGAFGITIDDFYAAFAAYRAAGFES